MGKEGEEEEVEAERRGEAMRVREQVWWSEGVLVLRGHVERVMRGEESCSGASWSERGSWRERERERAEMEVRVRACLCYTMVHSDVWRDPSV